MAKTISTNCARSLAMLSDYQEGVLDDAERDFVRTHLAECPPCLVVLQDVELIITTATVMRGEEGINYPDENVIWQRMRITKTTIH